MLNGSEKLLNDELVTKVKAETEKKVDEAEEFALNSPEPSPEAMERAQELWREMGYTE